MSSKKSSSIKTKQTGLTICQTCLSGMIMGFIAYSGSFSVVPIIFTITSILYGTKSLITIYATAFSQLLAGYLHTHSSRTGIAISTRIFHGFYIAKSEMKNRRKYNEKRLDSLKRFFLHEPLNALVISLMWETFTIFYIIQTELFFYYLKNSIIKYSSSNDLETKFLYINGITRYLAGCLSGMSTGLINHLWQRYQEQRKIPYAIFNTNKKKLKLEWNERKKILSPLNMENWIKVAVMFTGALFTIMSNIPNRTGLHLLDIHTKRLINDLLVIHGGWLFIRDSQMLIFKRAEKPPEIPLITIQSPLMDQDSKIVEDEQSKKLVNTV